MLVEVGQGEGSAEPDVVLRHARDMPPIAPKILKPCRPAAPEQESVRGAAMRIPAAIVPAAVQADPNEWRGSVDTITR